MDTDYTRMSTDEKFLAFARIAYMDGKLLDKEKLLLAEEGRRLCLSQDTQDRLLKQAMTEYHAEHG